MFSHKVFKVLLVLTTSQPHGRVFCDIGSDGCADMYDDISVAAGIGIDIDIDVDVSIDLDIGIDILY